MKTVRTFRKHADQYLPGKRNLPLLYRRPVEGFHVIAHRGASFYTPENTMPSFKKAYSMGADMIELDIMLTRDDIPVVIHDPQLKKTTDGSGLVREHSLEELKKLDAGSWFNRAYTGIRIPELEEVLRWASGRIALNIEIKSEAAADQVDTGVEEIAVTLVRRYGMERHVIFSSFSYPAVERLKRIAPEISCGLLYTRTLTVKESITDLVTSHGADTFNCHWRQLNRQWSLQLQDLGIPLFVYTVNTESRMRRLIKAGIDGIFTDRPDLLRSVAEDLLHIPEP